MLMNVAWESAKKLLKWMQMGLKLKHQKSNSDKEGECRRKLDDKGQSKKEELLKKVTNSNCL